MTQKKIEKCRRAFREWMRGFDDKPMVPPPMTAPEDKRKQPGYRKEQLKLW